MNKYKYNIQLLSAYHIPKTWLISVQSLHLVQFSGTTRYMHVINDILFTSTTKIQNA